MKPVLIILGSFFVFVGVVGIFLPGLPTTPFLLLASGCYVRSSRRLHGWLMRHPALGRYLEEFNRHKGIPKKTKAVSILVMWTMITLSAVMLAGQPAVVALLLLAGITGTVVMGRWGNRR